MPFRIEYSPAAVDHLKVLTARQRSTVINRIDEQLVHQPLVETRNRKPMRPNPLAPWELRVGSLRVYYDVQTVPDQVVFVRAIGVKDGNIVRIGGEEFEI